MLMETLFTIAKIWNQPWCPTTKEWTKKMYIYTMKYYTAIKKNEIMWVVTKWMKLESMLSEISQAHKDKYLMFLLICRI
jgi:hypothetical protein